MSFSGMPSVFATRVAAAAGLLAGGPDLELAVFEVRGAFLGSSGACEMNGYEYAPSITFAAPGDRLVDIAVVLQRARGRLLR